LICWTWAGWRLLASRPNGCTQIVLCWTGALWIWALGLPRTLRLLRSWLQARTLRLLATRTLRLPRLQTRTLRRLLPLAWTLWRLLTLTRALRLLATGTLGLLSYYTRALWRLGSRTTRLLIWTPWLLLLSLRTLWRPPSTAVV